MIRSGSREVVGGRAGSPVRLREVTREDARRLYDWRMEPGTREMFRHTEVVTFEQHLAVLEHYFQPDNDDRWFVIEAPEGPVGAIALYRLDAEGGAEWGRLIVDRRARGRGYGRRALELLVAHARELGLRELRCTVLDRNAVARNLYREVGFVESESERLGERRFVRCTLSLEGS